MVPIGFAANSYAFMLAEPADTTLGRFADRGFCEVEVMVHPGHLWPADLGAGARRDLRAAIERRGQRVISLNIPNIDLNIASTTPEARAYALALLEAVVALAGDLGVPGVVIGPGKPNPLMPAPQVMLTGWFHQALERLIPLATRVGTALWIENVPFSFLPDAASLVAAIEAFGDDRVGVVYDFANAHFIAEPLDAGLAQVGARLRLLHLSDTDRSVYRHAPLGAGTVPWRRTPDLVARSGYRGPIVLEIIAEDALADMARAREHLTALDWTGSPLKG